MTYEETINVINTWKRLMRKTSSETYAHEFIDAVEELEKRSIKYRWHDLRKCPNDLPSDSFRYVLVKVVHRYSESDGYYDYDMGFIHSDGVEKKWGFKSSKNTEIYKVVAWQEIKLFEDEE